MQKQSFNKNWRFFLGDFGNSWDDPDSSIWREIELPHDWSIERDRSPNNPSGVSNGFFEMGRGWYHKEFEIPPILSEKKILIEFEGVYMNAEVWLNEHLLTRHPYGYTSFTIDLSPYLRFDKKNSLRVLVDNASQPNSRWYSGSGIYRPVWLIVAERVHIAPYGIAINTPDVTPQTANVHIKTNIQSETDKIEIITLRTTIIAPDGSQAATAEKTIEMDVDDQTDFNQAMQVSNPSFWTPETPNLYQLSSEVTVNGGVVDTAQTFFGIRTIEYNAEKGFLLNGQPMLLRGGCVHHDNGILGATSFPRAEERKIEILKANGFNAIRCAHNPPAPALLDACDRLGMLVIDEAFDCWRIGKKPYDYHTIFDDWWKRDLDNMLQRDHNHPCIIMWSIGNEILERDGRSEGAAIAKKLAKHIHKKDTSRPITAAICHVWDELRTWEDTDAVFEHLDIGGYNYLWQEYTNDHHRKPKRVLYGAESFPLEALENWIAVEENPYVIGDFVWTAIDYLGEAGLGRAHHGDSEGWSLGEYPWHLANCGDIDICGFKRPQSHYRDMVWMQGEKIYLAVHPPYPDKESPVPTRWGWPDVWPNWNWEGHEGQNFKVDVYSACAWVELFLNDRSLGIQTTSHERLITSFEVPYEPGELKAIGYEQASGEKSSSKQIIAEARLKTISPPVAIHLKPDRSRIYSDADLCYITVEVTDAEGNIHPTADNNIFFTIQGPGEIAAIGNSNPVSTERYRGNQRRAHRGRCLVVVKSTTQGKITLRAQADRLEPGEIIIQAI